VIGNTFEINATNASTIGVAGGYTDLTALDFSGNWDGDDVGSAAYTKYVFPANTTGSFTNNLISATRAAATGFTIGNNSRMFFTGNTFVPGSTVGTLYSIGTGDILNIGPQNYSTMATFMSGTPATGSIITDNLGLTSVYGDIAFRRPLATRGTLMTAGKFSLSAAWGTTATVTNVRGTDSAFAFQVNSSGTGQANNAIVTVTFADGTWTNAPICTVSETSSATAVFWAQAFPTATSMQIVPSQGSTQLLPVAGGNYGFAVVCVGSPN
jgi:hypothetical protein